MTTPVEGAHTQDDHLFNAAQGWLLHNEKSHIAMTCDDGLDLARGTKRLPGVQVAGCLRDLPLHRLVDLSLAGVLDVTLVPTTCCSANVLTELVGSWRSGTGGLLKITVDDVAPARNWTWSLSAQRIPVDRRGLLGLSRRTPPWPIHEPGDDDQARLVASLRAVGTATITEAPPGVVLVASGCTACGVCVRACPHGSLDLVIDGSVATLQHAPDTCLGEQQCVSLCPVDALSVTGSVGWVEVLDGSPIVLASVRTAVCQRCQSRFPANADQEWCEPCRIRRSDPFGSHLPQAALDLLRARGHDGPA